MFLAPRHELIGQITGQLDQWAGFEYGLIVASQRSEQDLYKTIQVASVDTLVSRVIKRQNLILPPAKLVILDEAHLYMTHLRLALMQLFPYAKMVGLTATPGRHDGRAMDIGFDRLIEATTVAKLTEQGYLVPAEYYAPSKPDLKRVKVVAGDYAKTQTDIRMEPLLGSIVEHWLRYASERRTVVFANSVGHSVWLAERFRAVGVAAEHCDGSAPTPLRDAIFTRFRTGETQVLCNVDLATYGFDLPELDCVVLARPTLSVVKYLQMIGRGLRRAPGKRDCLVLDHSGAVHNHGFADEDRHWTLAGIRDVTKRAKKKDNPRTGERAKKKLHLRCPKCTRVFGGSLVCPTPGCGYFFERTAKAFKVVAGDLVQMKVLEGRNSEMERIRFYCELLGYLEERNARVAEDKRWKKGWAAFAYQERYGQLPPREWGNYTPEAPSLSTERFVKYVQIRRARRRNKEQAA